MNKEIKNTIGTNRIPIQRLTALLDTFGLKHISRQIADLLEEADLNNLSTREFLLNALETEIKGRNERRRTRNYAGAHFPPNVKRLEEFDPSELESGITATQIANLKELSWLDNHGNLFFSGPPGLGKTMIACGLGLHAIDCGYTVCFEKMSNLIRILDTTEIERKSDFRYRNIRRAQLLIIDEIGYTPINRNQANKFFTLISDMYETSSIIFTTNKEIVDWTEMIGDPVLTTALLDRILHHAMCFSLRGESYRIKHPEVFATANQD
ncbi:MAG: IS21-like element helper ATPase IstB [Coprobacillus sp.]|nr:IS21-like element helper ATPase IstB [Coprobacillus sp.]MCD8204951.1 IS21-like element helper ATPase IstB [Coprobacillus sp.]